MIGFPFTTLLGATLMAAVLLTTAFTEAFRMTLVFGVPFIGVLCLLYRWRQRSRCIQCARSTELLDGAAMHSSC